jgi:hypothetical protein
MRELFGAAHCRQTLIGSGLGAVAVLGMWGAYQTWAPTWAPKLVAPQSEQVTEAAKLATEAQAALGPQGRAGLSPAELSRLTEATTAAARIASEAARRSGAGQDQAAAARAEAEKLSLSTSLEGSVDAAVRSTKAATAVVKRAGDTARAATLMWMAIGSIVGAILGGLMGQWLGRRLSYAVLCVASVAMALLLYLTIKEYGPRFLAYVALAGVPITAFFGWLPLYLPELYPTRLRATGEGFCFNVGRIISAVGVFGTGALVSAFAGIPYAAATMSAIFLFGIPLILIAPETKGQELPE